MFIYLQNTVLKRTILKTEAIFEHPKSGIVDGFTTSSQHSNCVISCFLGGPVQR
jgi:hypothetical protein